MQFVARRYDDSRAVRLTIANGQIADVQPAEPHQDSTVPYVSPGWVDIQINGYLGQEFSSPKLTPGWVARIVRDHYRFGVTAVCPTLTTQSPDVFEHGVRTIAEACRQFADVARGIVGIHLEGPFISAEEGPRGAHPAEHCRPPDWNLFERWQNAADGRIALVTLSPEYPQAPDFIAKASDQGVVLAIGHTGADSRQILQAVEAGARLSTHLGNGAHRMLRRHPNYIWSQLAEDRLHASLIVDGHHLPPEVVRVFVRAKGSERIILVSDVSGLAGLPPGRYPSSGCELEILPDGRLVIAGQDQLLAGASRPIGAGIANVIRFAGVDLPTAVDMASRHPLKLLDRPERTLAVGEPADLVVFQWPVENDSREGVRVMATIAAGELVYGQLPP